MANTLWITGFQSPLNAQVVSGTGKPNLANLTEKQQVSFGSTSAAFNGQTRFIRVVADASCSINYQPPGATASASSIDLFLPANTPEYFDVLPGGTLAVVTNS